MFYIFWVPESGNIISGAVFGIAEAIEMSRDIGDVGSQITVNLVTAKSESVLVLLILTWVKPGKFNTSWRLLFTDSLVFYKIATESFLTHLTDHLSFTKR